RGSFWSNRLSFVKGVTEDSIRESAKKTAPVIAESISKTVTDPSFRDANGRKLSELKGDDFAKAISEEVGKALLLHEKELGLPQDLMKKGDDGKTNLDQFKESIREKLAVPQNYEK